MPKGSPVRLTHQGLKILSTFLAQPTDKLSGADLIRATNLASGTLYPILLRFEEAGLLESEWETGDPRELGRPRRRLYRVTPTGQLVAREALEPLMVRSLVTRPSRA
jgi:DNA-binding PadR family transcriptional regulator